MLITRDFSEFEPWSGAVETWDRIESENKIDELETLITELYGDVVDETTINDLLWFDEDWVLEQLGIRSVAQIEEDIEELKDAIDELTEKINILKTDFKCDTTDMDSQEKIKEYYETWYADDICNYESEITELKEKIRELEEELK